MSLSPSHQTGLFILDFARQATNGFLAGLEGGLLYKLSCPTGGNAAYVVGHLAFTDDMTLQMLAGHPSALTEQEQKLFGGGATPTENPADYPARERLMELFTERRQAIADYFKGLSEAELLAPVEGPMAQFGDTRAKLMSSLAWHESMHAGQLTVIRRQCDLPRVFG